MPSEADKRLYNEGKVAQAATPSADMSEGYVVVHVRHIFTLLHAKSKWKEDKSNIV